MTLGGERIAAVVDALGGLLGLLSKADQHDRAEIYARIGLQMTYRPGTETVLVEGSSGGLPAQASAYRRRIESQWA